jgi:hypothetical protein
MRIKTLNVILQAAIVKAFVLFPPPWRSKKGKAVPLS